MDGNHGGCDGGRRRFLGAAAATTAGAALASTNSARADEPQAPAGAANAKPAVPLVTLGRTGQKVTKLGMGTSWAVQPSFVQTAVFAGVRYIDTSESYENTVAEQVLGDALERSKTRKDVYLVTKNSQYRRATGERALKVIEERLDGSLARLKTDYVDCYYLHGMSGREMSLLKDPAVKSAFEDLKRRGKIKFSGLSCHDAKLPEILDLAAEVGWVDQIMFKYNFRSVNHDALQRAVDKAAKLNMGLVAMKTQGGAEATYPDKVKEFVQKGFKREVAAIKSVFTDERMHVVVSEMTNREQLRENMSATREALTAKEARLLEEHRERTANLYCHGCGHLCETSAKGVPVATVLRYLRYYQAYGKRDQARALYQALPAESRAIGDIDADVLDAACPHGLPVTELLRTADKRLGLA